MVKRSTQHANALGTLVVESLLIDLAVSLSEVTGVPCDKIILNYKRRVRRGNPGLTREYVKEEAIRRMAKEAACYTIYYQPGELIEEMEHAFRKFLRESEHGEVLQLWEYRFPVSAHCVFASRKYLLQRTRRPPTILRDEPEWFDMIEGESYCFGRGREWTSFAAGAINANIFEFRGSLPDVIHCHGAAEETYWVQPDSGPVEMYYDGEILRLEPGNRVIIEPGAYHATRPAYRTPCGVTPIHVVVIASPPFDAGDQHAMQERPKSWYEPDAAEVE